MEILNIILEGRRHLKKPKIIILSIDLGGCWCSLRQTIFHLWLYQEMLPMKNWLPMQQYLFKASFKSRTSKWISHDDSYSALWYSL